MLLGINPFDAGNTLSSNKEWLEEEEIAITVR